MTAAGSDGEAMAVGVPWMGPGAVHLFQRDTAGMWQPLRVVEQPTGAGARAFGSTVTFEGDALWISAPGGAGQVFCLADWRASLSPLLFATGSPEVALGRSILTGGKPFMVGAPGHGHATFEDAKKANVRWQCRPRLQHMDLGGGASVHAVVHGAPWHGVAALGAGGLPPNKRVELRISDPSAPGGWSLLGASAVDSSGAWNWSGTLPAPANTRAVAS